MKRFKNILCVVELEKDNDAVLEQAVRLAENNQAKLTVMSVLPPMTNYNGLLEDDDIVSELEDLSLDTQKQALDKLLDDHRQRIEINTEVALGTAFIQVIRTVLRNEHDLVIKSPDTTDSNNHAFSGDDKQLLRKCPCPVWMIRLFKDETFHRILAAVDIDDNYAPEELVTRQNLNTSIMELAGSLAVSEFAELNIASSWNAMAESAIRFAPFIQRPNDEVDAYVDKARRHHSELLQAELAKLSAKLGDDAINYIKPKLHDPKGSARKAIPTLAKQLEVDCIVMGTVGRVGIPGFFIGNTAESLLDQLECSILAIKPEGFVTPITLTD